MCISQCILNFVMRVCLNKDIRKFTVAQNIPVSCGTTSEGRAWDLGDGAEHTKNLCD